MHFKPVISEFQFYSRKASPSPLLGEISSPFKQKDVEFEEYKQYVMGDDAHAIDWRASLRAGKLLVRKSTQMRNLSLLFLMDVSESMLFSSHSKLKCEFAAELIAALTFHFLRHSNSVGFAFFTNKIFQFLPPDIGMRRYFLITKLLKNPSFYGGPFNLTHTLNFLQDKLQPNTVVIIVSDFLGMEKNWKTAVKSACGKFDVRCFVVRDPRDMKLEKRVGRVIFSDPFSTKRVFADVEQLMDDYKGEAYRQLMDVRTTFNHYGGKTLLLETDKPFVKPVVNFLASPY